MPTFRDDLHLGHSVPMVDTEDIVDGAVTEPKLADDSVSTRTIQDGAVTEPKIAEKAVTEPKLADAAVSTRTIKFRAVTESKIGDSAVSTRTIQNGAVTNPKIANGAVSMNKLDNETQTLIQRGADSSWTPMGDYDVDALYYANDLVFDPETNSSYLSLRADNMGHAVTDEAWWMKVLDGSYVNLLEEELQQLVDSISEGTQQQVEELNEALEALEAQADQSRQDIQDIVDSLAVVQTTGQSASDVMSQKAVTDSIEVRSNVTIINTGSCVRRAVMKADGSILTSGVDDGYFISNYISIPDGADTITYESVTSYSANFSYGCLFDSSNNLVLRFQGSGKIILSEYPTAKSVVLGIPPDITTSPHIDILTHVSIENACVIDDRVVTSKTSADCTTSGFISAADGHMISPAFSQGYYISSYIDISEYDSIKYSLWNQSASGNFIGGALYRADKSPLLKLYGDNVIDLADYPAAKYLVLAVHPERGIPYAELIKGSRRLVKEEAENLAERVEDCEEELMYEKASGSQTAGNVDTSVAGNAGSSYYAMGVAGSNAEHDGTINQVSFCAQTTGTIYFMLGVWDETHEYFSIRTTHTYSVTSTGNQTLLVSMPILKGETLMVNVSSGVKIKQKNYTTPPTGSKNAIVSTDGGHVYHKYGPIRIYLSWTMTWSHEKTLKQKVTDNAASIDAVKLESKANGQSILELQASRLLIQGDDNKVYRLVVNGGVLGIECTTPQNILVLAHSFACILTGVWQRGMTSSRVETDWVSQINSVFLGSVQRVNMVSWEQAFPNPSSTLSGLLDSYLTSSIDAIFIMCGANVPSTYRTQAYGQTNFAALVNYCKTRSTNADIYVCSPGYTPETDGFNIGIKAGAKSEGATYISTYSTQPDKLANYGDVVWNASNNDYSFVVNSSGRVNHPNDIWHLFMANNILSALGYNTLDKYHDISYNTSVEHRGYSRWVEGGHCTVCTFGNSQPTASIVDANNNAVSCQVMSLSSVTWETTPSRIPTYAIHFQMPASDVTITIQ